MAMSKSDTHACWRRIGVWSSDAPSCPELKRVSHCHNCEVFKQAARAVFSDTLVEEIETGNPAVLGDGDWSLVPFRMGSVWLALPSANIVSIAPVQEIHSIPRRSNLVLHGVVAVQGEIYVSVSLSKLMGLSREESSAPDYARGVFERLVIASLGEVQIAFKVDEVRGIRRIHKKDAQNSSPDFHQGIAQFIQCSVMLEEDRSYSCGVLDEKGLAVELQKVLE